MKNSSLFSLIAVFFSSILMSSCTVVGDIFKTGMGVGIFVVVFIIAIIGGIILFIGKNK